MSNTDNTYPALLSALENHVRALVDDHLSRSLTRAVDLALLPRWGVDIIAGLRDRFSDERMAQIQEGREAGDLPRGTKLDCDSYADHRMEDAERVLWEMIQERLAYEKWRQAESAEASKRLASQPGKVSP